MDTAVIEELSREGDHHSPHCGGLWRLDGSLHPLIIEEPEIKEESICLKILISCSRGRASTGGNHCCNDEKGGPACQYNAINE